MSYSLDNFCDDTRSILKADESSDGKDKIRQNLERLLSNEDFCMTYVGAGDNSGMRQIYDDPELHFCILAYNMEGARTSPPHDHGSSWAVYGQAAGFTDMTIWETTDQGDINLEPVRTFRLEAGMAGLFDVREIHSIAYAAGSKFVRITGVDMSQESRRVFDPETGAVKEIEHVGTGSSR